MKKETISKMHAEGKVAFGYALREGDYREPWQIFRIMAEFVEGYQFLSQFSNEVTMLGSARLKEKDKHYEMARELARLLGERGFTIITGGGPGIMEAGNRGAKEGGGESVGLNIQLPFEQVINPYVTKSTSFYYFFTRKVMLTSPANAFVYFPGGFGTLDEFFEVVDLMDLGIMSKTPLVLMGSGYWGKLLRFLRGSCCPLGSVTEKQVKSWFVSDSAAEAFTKLKDVTELPAACAIDPANFNCQGNLDWRIFRIMAELVEGFEFVTGLKQAVTILGSKDVGASTRYFDSARRLGADFATHGYTVITGGQTGVAEAVNQGAFESGGESVGIALRLRGSIKSNPYLTRTIAFDFPFTRKLIVTTPTKAFVFYPGGFGTLHQLFEILTLMQTGKMRRRPVVLFDHEFWQPLVTFIKQTLIHEFGTAADEDDELFQVVDSEDGVMRVIEQWRNSTGPVS